MPRLSLITDIHFELRGGVQHLLSSVSYINDFNIFRSTINKTASMSGGLPNSQLALTSD
jgi:hypothetical protein